MKKEHSIVKNGMVSSLGLFLTKFIGIIYIIPLNAILATTQNRDFYSIGFKFYEIILSVSFAGFPVAIATLVSRYEAQGNYEYARLVKKYGGYVLTTLGFMIMVILLLFANPIAAMIKNPAPQESINVIATMIRILAVAVFIVLNLGSLRGFYQGIKNMTMYATSQFIEQIVRVAIIVIGGFLVVNIFKFDRVMAVYITAFGATISALVSYILLFIDYNKTYKIDIYETEEHRFLKKQIISETIRIGLPYMLMSLFAYATSIIELSMFNQVFATLGFSLENRNQIFAALTMQGEKLIAIPLVIATGFSLASLPYLTEALEVKQYRVLRENIIKILSIVLLVGVPLCMGLILFTKPIFFIFFGNTIPKLGVPIVQASAIVAMMIMVTNICVSISMAINMRKYVLFTYVILLFVKLAWYYPSAYFLGAFGPLFSTFLSLLVQLILLLIVLHSKFKVQLNILLKNTVVILLGVIVMVFVGIIFSFLPLQYSGLLGAIVAMMMVIFFGGLSLIGYVSVVAYFGLVKRLLNIDILKLVRRK